ncbi:MAG: hypothetical protein N2316_03690 [Spirochaetes bacterium]|nr:hypothetical protein [Spirochaetota bacterium]
MVSKKITEFLAMAILMILVTHSGYAEKSVIVFPFYDASGDVSIGKIIAEKVALQKFYDIHFVLCESNKAVNIMNSEEINRAFEVAHDKKSTHVICGTVERSYGDGYLVKAVLLHLPKKQSVYATEYFIQSTDQLDDGARTIAGRCALFLHNKMCDKIEEVRIVTDDERGSISIQWNKKMGIEEYAIYRLPLETGPPIKIAEVKNTNEFFDIGAIRGIEYRYGVAPIIEGISCEALAHYSAHLRIPPPEGLKIDEEKKKKTVTDKQIAKELKNDIVKKHLEFLSNYYMHPVKLNLALYIGRSYIEKRQVIALSDFENYEIDREKKQIVLIGKNKNYIVGMAAAAFFAFLEKAEEKKIPEVTGLIDRLFKNAIAYVVPRGEKPIKDEYGHTVFLPYYEAIGLSTEYFKNYSKWESNTIMMSTSDEELKRKMKAAQQRGGNIE